MKLSIVIPCYNEERYIQEIISRVQAALLPQALEKEIIVVDDGSWDGTRAILARLGSDIQVILKEKNEGKGSALKAGFRAATGDYIIVQDADLEYNPDDYGVLLKPILEGRAQIVFGSRNMNARNQSSSALFFYGGRALTGAFNVLFGSRLTDITTCYKLFPSSLVDQLIFLPSNDFVFDGVEFTYVLTKSNFSLIEVPITYRPRHTNEGKKIRISDGIKFLLAMLRIKLGLDVFIRYLRYRQMARLIHQGVVLVDVGCGREGFLLHRMKHTIKHGYGIDKKIKDWEKDNITIKGFDFDGKIPPPLPAACADQATMLAVLEHVLHPEFTLQSIYRLLKDGGELILTTPTPLSKPILEFLAYRLRLIDEGEIRDHKHYFSKQELIALLQKIGFKDIRHRYFECGVNQIAIARK